MDRRPLNEQSALASYRLLTSPDAQARERMLRGLSQRMAAGSLPDLIVPGPPAQLASLANAVPALTRRLLVLGGAVGGCTLVAVFTWLWLSHAEPPPRRGAARPRVEAAPAVLAPSPVQEPVRDPPSFTQERTAPAARIKPSAARGLRRREAPAVKPREATPPSAASAPPQGAVTHRALDEELKLMRSAYEALRAGQTDVALEQLAQHAARYPDGELAESREVTRMLALCQAGKTETARAQAARFLARAPTSPYATRVRLICKEPAKSSPR